MAEFRKISVLVAVVLLLGLAGTASAQVAPGAFTCVANAAVPPSLRSEGMTELVGDIVLDCTGGVPTQAPSNIARVNFTVYLNTAVTSRLYGTTGQSEALLLIDEPTSTSNPNSNLQACPNLTGCDVVGTGTTAASPGVVLAGFEPFCGGGAGCPAAPSGTTRANVYTGIASGNQVQFIGVPVDAPGTSGHRIFRITNVRANASGISAGASGTPGVIQALISASGSTSVPISNPTLVVGYVNQGLDFFVRKRDDNTASVNTTTNIAFPQCNNLSRTTASGGNAFVAQFVEKFPTSFKVRQSASDQSKPGAIFNTESGFYVSTGIPLSGGGTLPANVGLADAATRLKVVINNIPAGVSVYASNSQLSVGNTAGNAAVLLSNEAGGSIIAPATNTDFTCNSGGMCSGTTSAYQLPIANGSATAVWEVAALNGGTGALTTDTFGFGIWFSWTGNAAQNSPAPGTATAVGGFAPTPGSFAATASTAAVASSTFPVPRFIDGTQSKAILSVYVCRTNLLFPFVTNQAGFDTGLAIANTSTDPFGTTAQAGSCTLYAYGANAPAPLPTGNIASGTVYANLASVAMPAFQGYVIAQCSFQYAHGFAFVSDFGARNLAMGYLALVIPDVGAGSRSAVGQGSASGGEGLIN